MIKSLITLAVIFLPVFVLSYLTRYPAISRHKYSFIASFSVGIQLFILAIMFTGSLGLYIGLALLLLAFPGIYPITYFYFYQKYLERVKK